MVAKSLSTSQKFAALVDVAGKLAEFCQGLFPLLIAHADDWGCLPGDVFTVKHLVHPTSPRKLQEFETALDALQVVGLIQRYEAEEKAVVFIRSWYAHQQLKGHDKDGRTRNFPAPPEIPNDSASFAQIRPAVPKSALREGKRTEEKGREEEPAPPLSAVSAQGSTPELSVQAVVKIWNDEVATPSGLPAVKAVSESRRKHVMARLKAHGLAVVRETMLSVGASDFLSGRTDTGGWAANFDWLMTSEQNFAKVLEGNYDNRAQRAPQPPQGNLPDAAATRAKYLVS